MATGGIAPGTRSSDENKRESEFLIQFGSGVSVESFPSYGSRCPIGKGVLAAPADWLAICSTMAGFKGKLCHIGLPYWLYIMGLQKLVKSYWGPWTVWDWLSDQELESITWSSSTQLQQLYHRCPPQGTIELISSCCYHVTMYRQQWQPILCRGIGSSHCQQIRLLTCTPMRLSDLCWMAILVIAWSRYSTIIMVIWEPTRVYQTCKKSNRIVLFGGYWSWENLCIPNLLLFGCYHFRSYWYEGDVYLHMKVLAWYIGLNDNGVKNIPKCHPSHIPITY